MASTLEKSLGLDELNYPVPAHSNSIKYMLGGITIFCIALAVLSGIFLAMFYNPDPAKAHASIEYINSEVYLGDFVRNVHFWSANIAMLLVLFHVIRVFINGSYKRPRQATWLSGVLLFAIMIGLFFSGTVLKWDQEAVEAQGHVDAVAEKFGTIGKLVISTAGESVPYLTRLYVAHIGILILLLFAVLFVHLFLIKKHGISPKPVYDAAVRTTHGMGSSNFRDHLKKLTGFGFLTIGFIATLSLLAPAALGAPGVSGMEVTKPPWLFLPFYGLENEFGLNALLWAPIAIFALMLIVPFVDRNQWLSPARRKVVVTIGALLIAVLVVLGYNAWRSPAHSHLGNLRIDIGQTVSNFLFPKVWAHGSAEPEPGHDEQMSSHQAAVVPSSDNHTDKKTSELAIIFSLILIFSFAGAVLVLA
ncbi:hypothetical protein A2708_00955 [Candidatus Saccharibacteria bacterium RIFCSPHIGHO2_01_FULL_49_21]|nr:MAG: hypothetical protein A2708_00955 [Candidatus Saccharibacteria bacterium RIFCSPHIGHO2_01_FULL_49_21]OGL38015.1 MAG: hypothetical protein A3B63_03240 [Candidatus Saccharibacteria bacterium RIFCSPLOWO2_01_FULL_49_22]